MNVLKEVCKINFQEVKENLEGTFEVSEAIQDVLSWKFKDNIVKNQDGKASELKGDV